MVLFERMIRRMKKLYLTDVALEIAVRQRDNVWNQVAHRIGEMSSAEARGFVRARVAGMVRFEVDRVLRQNHQLQVSQREKLAQLTTVAVIDQAMVDSRVCSQSTVEIRRAA